MNKTALVLLSIASVAGLASMATATPFTANSYHSEGLGNVVRAAGLDVSGLARGIGLGNVVPGGSFSTFRPGSAAGGGPFTSAGGTGGVHSLASSPLSTPVSAVPEGGSSLLLLGAGLFALALLRRRRHQIFSH